MPTKARASLADRQVVAEEAAPTQLEDGALGLGQGHESITGVTDGIGRCSAQLDQSIGLALVLLNQNVATGKGLAAHAIEHALKLRAMPSMWLRAEFLRQKRNILTEIVHEPLLIDLRPLTMSDGSLSAAWSRRNWGTVTCREPAAVAPTKSPIGSPDQSVGMRLTYGYMSSHVGVSGRHGMAKSIRSAPSGGQGSGQKRLRLG